MATADDYLDVAQDYSSQAVSDGRSTWVMSADRLSSDGLVSVATCFRPGMDDESVDLIVESFRKNVVSYNRG